MVKRKREPDPVTPTPSAETEEAGPVEVSGAGGAALVEQPGEAVRRLSDELAALKDQHLRLAADFDNFRKRTQRERGETWARAQAHVVSNILDALDDLARVSALDPAGAQPKDVLEGVQLVERKLVRELQSAGLERVGAPGERFDPNLHEAVTTAPAQGPDQDHVIAGVLQPGYRFGGALLRPARVTVYTWQERAPGDGDGAGSP